MRNLLFFLVVTLLLSSCNFNSNVMLKAPKDYNYTALPDSITPEYRIQPNDIMIFRLYSKDGYKLIDMLSDQSRSVNTSMNEVMYNIEYDGRVKLPVLGYTQLGGMTIQEAERFLEQQYSRYYNNPFVLITINTKRVIVFPGEAGQAKVIPLLTNNTTVIEALAQAGGISKDGKAQNVKVIRGDGGPETQVYQLDLSTIEGINDANLILVNNDIIYVETRSNFFRNVMYDIGPLYTFITTTLVLVLTIQAVRN